MALKSVILSSSARTHAAHKSYKRGDNKQVGLGPEEKSLEAKQDL